MIFDHFERKIDIVSNAHPNNDPTRAYQEAVAKIENLEKLLAAPLPQDSSKSSSAEGEKPEFVSNIEKEEFCRIVERAKEYIRAGDIFQVVPSQRFSAPLNVDPFDVYRALRVINPSSYMYYLEMEDLKVAGSSPEVLVRAQHGKVELRPIAGSRPRGADSEEDERLVADLLQDPKELAEHIMLLDLGRNDIGRVCKYGSVRVTEKMVIEKYSHVIHIVSHVVGQLSEDKNIFDLVGATFPAGTLSGAPKIRAMEIIDELEVSRRGLYGGGIGYFGFNGNLDMCITIRTVIIHGGKAYVQAGAGIVADSVAETEYEETINKAKRHDAGR